MGAKTMKNLEQDAQQHRAGLADALGELTEALEPERLGRQAIDDAAQMGRQATAGLVQAAKDNPVALAFVGIGAAMLLAGTKARPAQSQSRAVSLDGQDERIERAAARMKTRQAIQNGRPAGPSASAMRRMLDSGLDKLGPDAQARVRDLRLKAIDAQEAAERHARNAKKAVVETHYAQPYVTGLAAAGLGGLIGALLPGTQKEADMLGAKRDALLKAAEARLREELAGLEAKGKAAVTEAVDAGKRELRAQTG